MALIENDLNASVESNSRINSLNSLKSEQFNGDEKLDSYAKYGIVAFDDIKEFYSIENKIIFKYHIRKHDIKMHSTDYVALYKVNWKNIDQFIIKKNCSINELNLNQKFDNEIEFDQCLLEKITDLEEFYQLCYITGEGVLQGASIPFRFVKERVENVNNLNEEEEFNLNNVNDSDGNDDEFIVVKTHRTLLEERIKELANKNGFLEYKNNELSKKVNELQTIKVNYEKNLIQLNNEVSSIKSDINCLKMEKLNLSTNNDKLEKLNNEFTDKLKINENDLKTIKLQNDELFNEINKFNSINVEKTSEIKQLTNENKRLIDDYTNLKSLTKKYSDIISKLEIDSDKRERQLNILNAECERLRGQLVRTERLYEDKQNDNLILSKNIQKLEGDLITYKMSDEEQLTNLCKDLKLKDDLNEQLKKQLSEQESKNLELEMRINTGKTEYESLFLKYKQAKSLIKEQNKRESKQEVNKVSIESSTEASEAFDSRSTAVKVSLEQDIEPTKKEETLLKEPCKFCDEVVYFFTEDEKHEAMLKHLESKHGRFVCPVCSDVYTHQLEEYFNDHVQKHFERNTRDEDFSFEMM